MVMSSNEPNDVGAQLTFPLEWHGRLVVFSGVSGTEDQVRRIYAGLGMSDGQVETGNTSSKGKYLTYQLSCTAQSLVELRTLFHELESLPGVRMLI